MTRIDDEQYENIVIVLWVLAFAVISAGAYFDAKTSRPDVTERCVADEVKVSEEYTK